MSSGSGFAYFTEKLTFYLAGVAQWIECGPANPSVQSGHVLGLRARSPVGGAQEATTH